MCPIIDVYLPGTQEPPRPPPTLFPGGIKERERCLHVLDIRGILVLDVQQFIKQALIQ